MYSRGDKEEPLDIIRHEINMLKHCYQRLQTMKWDDEGERNVYIEGFLLHYRNLIEFFVGNKPKQKEPYEPHLNILKPKSWAVIRVYQAQLRPLARIDLYKKRFREISQYLQHCTQLRSEINKEWPTSEMYLELAPTISEFTKLFLPSSSGPEWVVSPSPSDQVGTASIEQHGSEEEK